MSKRKTYDKDLLIEQLQVDLKKIRSDMEAMQANAELQQESSSNGSSSDEGEEDKG